MIPQSYIFDDRRKSDNAASQAGSLESSVLAFVVIGIASALTFVIGSQILIALPTGLPAWVVSAFCYALCVLPAYLAHRRFSFRSSAPHGMALPRYVLVQSASIVLATLFSYIAYGAIGLASPVAAVVVVTLTSAVSFVVLRSWAFRHRPRSDA